MEIQEIISLRNHFPDSLCYHLVYEWEEQMSKDLGWDICSCPTIISNHYLNHLPILPKLFLGNKFKFVFEMGASEHYYRCFNRKNIISCIIDFYMPKTKFHLFYNTYRRNRVTLVSSAEVVEKLSKNNCPLNIKHWALSLPDKYAINGSTRFEKKYDIVMAGRQGACGKIPEFTKRYIAEHKDLNYVYRTIVDGKQVYVTSEGEVLGNMASRTDYIKLIQQSRISVYSTPGIDGNKVKLYNGYNQVTPRFLELIASGCHVLAFYPDNADTKYYELDKMTFPFHNYEEFSNAMDKARKMDVDMGKYSDYLKKHYTSTRILELKKILSEL